METFRRKIVGVVGSSAQSIPRGDEVLAYRLGAWIARSQHHLLTGGGPGVMAAASQGFCSVSSRQGLSIGVIPEGKLPGFYPNLWVELPIYTHLRGENPIAKDSRNHINIRTCHALVALPGGSGTQAEIELAIAREVRYGIVACLRENDKIGNLTATTIGNLGVVVAQDYDNVIRVLAPFLLC